MINQYSEQIPPVSFTTNVKIMDDLGEVLLDKSNAIHPQNMARIIARALANEPKASIYRVALGNGGTVASAGGALSYKTPNDGTSSDSVGWQTRLYNEIYSEVIDDQSSLLGSGLGAVPANDPKSVGLSGPGVRSSEVGNTSLVTIDMTINPCEPRYLAASSTDMDGNFVFDELGLFSEGLSNLNTRGSQIIEMDNKVVTDNTGLIANQTYSFSLTVNGTSGQLVTFNTPLTGSGVLGQSTFITYADIMPLINAKTKPLGVTMTMTDQSIGVNTNGNIVLTSKVVGPGSNVSVDAQVVQTGGAQAGAPTLPVFSRLLGFVDYGVPIDGQLAGLQNDSTSPELLRERLLTHIIFEPITKKANRTLRLVYTLGISVAPTKK